MFKNPSTPTGTLVERHHNKLWSPYAPLNAKPLYGVLDAHESTLRLTTETGKTYQAIDAMSSWWCQIHGYRNPVLDQTVKTQIDHFSHVMFGGLTHHPAVELADRLIELSPGNLNHVFLADSGSVSVEVTLKLAVQYQSSHGREKRDRFVALRGGYHGDTTGAMSVCDPIDGMHSHFKSLVKEQFFLPRPPLARWCAKENQWQVDEQAQNQWEIEAREKISQWKDHLAAIIAEPIVQGAGGMYFYHPRCLQVLRELATEYDVLLIFDEIATGFGRTGELFACQWTDVTPDVMTVGKALTGGYMTQAAVLVSTTVAAAISNSQLRAIMHGPTFMANPLASAVSCASIDLVMGRIEGTPHSSSWTTQVPRIQEALTTGLEVAKTIDAVEDVRVIGAIGVIELDKPVDIPQVTARALEHGVWVRPFRNTVYTMPTYICTDEEVAQICKGLTQAVAEVHGS